MNTFDCNPLDLHHYVNVTAAIHQLQGNCKTYAILLRSFLANPLHGHLIDALHTGDVAIAKAFAHGINSVASNLFLVVLQQDAQNLETQLEHGLLDQRTFDIISSDWAKTQCYARYVLESIQGGMIPS